MKRPSNFDADLGAISAAFPVGERFTNGHAAEVLERAGVPRGSSIVRASVVLRYAAEVLPDVPEAPQLRRSSLPRVRGRRWVFTPPTEEA